jgi:hypothetical protein
VTNIVAVCAEGDQVAVRGCPFNESARHTGATPDQASLHETVTRGSAVVATAGVPAEIRSKRRNTGNLSEHGA